MPTRVKGLVTRVERPEHLVAFDVTGATVKMYVLTEDKLDLLSSGGKSSVNLALFTLTSGIAVTLIITLYTVNITDVYTRATFWAVFWGMAILSILFGANAVRDYLQARRLVNQIKEASPTVKAEKPLI